MFNPLRAIRYWYWRMVPYEYRPWTLWRQFLCWAWYRHTTIKSRYLGHQWEDSDRVLTHSMFEVLGRYLEKEDIDLESSNQRKLLNLWEWWTNAQNIDRHKEIMKPVEAFPTRVYEKIEDHNGLIVYKMITKFKTEDEQNRYYKALDDYHKAIEADHNMLVAQSKRLIDLSVYMWG